MFQSKLLLVPLALILGFSMAVHSLEAQTQQATDARPESEPIHQDAFQNGWHQFRGPNADGSSATAKPPTEWSESKNVRWKYPIQGVGSSTPIVLGDKIFLLSAVKTDRIDESKTKPEDQPKNGVFDIKFPNAFYQFNVICVHRKTGKRLWRKTAVEAVPNEGRHNDNNFASSTPTTDGKRLFVSFGSQGYYCFDLNGKLLWKRDLGKVFTRYNFGEAASLVVSNNRLIIVRDNETKSRITVLNSENGKTVWEKDRDEPSCWATPVVTHRSGKTQLITNGHTRIRSYDLENGELIWECGGQVRNVTPSPIVDGDRVYCMSGYRGNIAVSIPLDATGDITDSEKIQWKLTDGTPYVPSPVLHRGLLFFNKSNSNILTCVEAKSGKVQFQRVRLPRIRSIYASPTAADGKVFYAGRGGAFVVLSAATKFEVVATNQLDDRFDASPVPVGNQLFLRGRKFLYCIENEK